MKPQQYFKNNCIRMLIRWKFETQNLETTPVAEPRTGNNSKLCRMSTPLQLLLMAADPIMPHGFVLRK